MLIFLISKFSIESVFSVQKNENFGQFSMPILAKSVKFAKLKLNLAKFFNFSEIGKIKMPMRQRIKCGKK
jgi:hypothetical protein